MAAVPTPARLGISTRGAAGGSYSAITRSLRFIVLEGLLVYIFGDQARVFIEKYMEWVLVGFLVLVVLGFVALRYIF